MAFDKGNWAYDDINTIFQFCKWADGQDDLVTVFKEAQKVSKDNQFLIMALVGYIHKREKIEQQEVSA